MLQIMTLTLLRKVFCGILLLSDKHPTFTEKLIYYISIIGTLSPVIYIAEGLNLWLSNNKQFVSFVICSVLVNMIVGAYFHKKNKTFSWELLLKRNSLMVLVLLTTYTMLEMLRLTAGNSIFAESFRIVIQISTLLYPISKILKNLYILSNKQFPPAFVMEKLYNFEKTGNLNELLKTDNDQKEA